MDYAKKFSLTHTKLKDLVCKTKLCPLLED